MAYPQLTNTFTYPVHTNQLGNTIVGLGTIVGQGITMRRAVYFAGRPKGTRTQAIDMKLTKVREMVKRKPVEGPSHKHVAQYVPGITYPAIASEDLIAILGNYNPLYACRPKKLAMYLLNHVNPYRMKNSYTLEVCGLVYHFPSPIGIRAERYRTTAAGVNLLKHWAVRFPKFAPYVTAYMSEKTEREIVSECVDMMMGHRPASFRKVDEANVKNVINWEAKQYRKAREQQAAQFNQQSANQSYQQANQLNLLRQIAPQVIPNTGQQGIIGSALKGLIGK